MKKPGTANGKTSKMDAVRQALKEMGKDAKPLAILDFVKTKHGVVMTAGMVSNYKSLLLAKKKGKAKAAKAAKAMGAAPVASTHVTASRGTISLEDIRAVKALADRIGVEKVKELAAVLAK